MRATILVAALLFARAGAMGAQEEEREPTLENLPQAEAARNTSFLETREEHAFFRGWLTEFTDADVVALICPRPLLIQTGKQDRIAHWPQVVEEFREGKRHYEKLGVGERIEMDLHEGGHEARVETGVRFLERWLMQKPEP